MRQVLAPLPALVNVLPRRSKGVSNCGPEVIKRVLDGRRGSLPKRSRSVGVRKMPLPATAGRESGEDGVSRQLAGDPAATGREACLRRLGQG